MDKQLQQRAVSVAGRLSAVARDASRRIHASQRAILAEQAARKEKEERLLNGRLSRAKAGLRRLLTFAASKPIQRIAKTGERLGGSRTLFYEDHWNIIGTSPKSHVTFLIGPCDVTVTMASSCHTLDSVSATFPYKEHEVAVREELSSRLQNPWASSSADILHRMAIGTMSSLPFTSEESAEAFRVLASWSRPASFERVATSFLEHLERELQRQGLRAA